MEASKHLKKQKSLIELPVETLDQITLELPCHEFGRFLQTCRHVYVTQNLSWIWWQRFLRQFGKEVFSKALQESSPSIPLTDDIPKDKLVELYNHYWRMTIPAAGMFILHLDDYSWSLTNHHDKSKNIKFTKNFNPIQLAEFRAITSDTSEVVHILGLEYAQCRFQRHEASHISQCHEFQEGPLFIDKDYQNVLVQFRDHSGYKSGIVVNYVRLIEEDDPRGWDPLNAA
ncbi:hypothetical protein BGX27_007189 [Mortierella sp. AM989]|nr:hypothetical protein BGX27_007189 [Mortierella sp. AM989]